MEYRTLVHICCADCGLKLMDQIEGEKTLYFYNPNIHPESEWQARKNAIKQVFSDKPVELIFTNWTPKDYFEVVKSAKGRCRFCWRLRLEKTFVYAAAHGFNQVSSTLFTSLYHDQSVLRSIAKELSNKFGIGVFFPDEVDHCLKTAGFYKQNYCGCVHSLNEKYREKYS
jgi:predicted adenine nucleotide alpha hydrolase (AANH) superfamily ATPase